MGARGLPHTRRHRGAAVRSVVAATALVTATLLGACSSQGTDTSRGYDDEPRTTEAAGATPPAVPTRLPSPPQEDRMRIQITIGDQRVEAVLDESAAARDLLAQLPVTLEMRDHGSVEKTGRLPSPLSLVGQPAGADPAIGDLGYYAPGNDLVLYYGDQSYFDGIVVLGRMTADAAERIAAIDGSATAVVSALT